jgi:RNA polymerase sigma factor (sigma-70 family)
MTLQHAASGRLAEFMETNELNWDVVYAHEAPRIYNHFRFRLGSDSDVEELTARTFERAWRSRSRYRRDLAGFATWLFKIAQNIATDHLRSRRLRRVAHLAAAVCSNSLLVTDTFVKVKLVKKLVAALDVGSPYVARGCEAETVHPPANAAHP